jgi:signal transduction histidine kinase
LATTPIPASTEDLARKSEAFHSTKQLGLSVSRNILQKHDGGLDVQSEMGRGTTFTVWLSAEGA